MTVADQLKKIKNNEPAGTKNIIYKGKNQTLPWFEIPVELLKYNYVNGRIASDVKEFNQLGKDLDSLEPDEANSIVAEWLWKKSEPANKKTLQDLTINEQLEPGVVTSDGIIVDGNRRFMLTCKLNEGGASKRLFKAVILDETYSDSKSDSLQIKLLETQLQITKDEKVSYGPIEKYIRIKEFMRFHDEGHLEKENVKKLFNLKTIKELDDIVSIADLMEQYLDYIKAPNMWSRLKSTEDLFINLEKCLNLYKNEKGRAGWNFNKTTDVIKYRKLGFDIIRWVYNKTSKGWDPKKVRPLFFKNSESAIFFDKTIFNEFAKTIDGITKNIKTESIKNHSEQNNVEPSVSAEQIDKDWAKQINNTMVGALGRAETKIFDRKKGDRPGDLIEDSLHKLENLIDTNRFESDRVVEINSSALKNLREKDREKNYKLADSIRKIAEKLKRELEL